MIIKKHLIYVDAKSVRRIGKEKEEKKDEEREIERMREEVLKKAQIEADKIISEAKEKAKRIIEQAQKEYEEKISAASRELEEKMKEVETQRKRLENLENLLREKIGEAVKEIVEESLPILKVIYKKILEKDMDEDLARRRIESALERIYETSGVRFRISPEDAHGLEDTIKLLKGRGFEVVVDPSLKKGDVLVETSLGILDKTTSFRWKMVEDILEEVL